MTHSDIQDIITGKKGQFASVHWQRTVKLRKEHKDKVILKSCKTVVRCGITYDNLNNVIEKRENGELPPSNQGLPWGEWEAYPYFIGHKGTRYVRLYPVESARVVVEYTMDKQFISNELVKAMALASEFSERETPDCITVKEENIIDLK